MNGLYRNIEYTTQEVFETIEEVSFESLETEKKPLWMFDSFEDKLHIEVSFSDPVAFPEKVTERLSSKLTRAASRDSNHVRHDVVKELDELLEQLKQLNGRIGKTYSMVESPQEDVCQLISYETIIEESSGLKNEKNCQCFRRCSLF